MSGQQDLNPSGNPYAAPSYSPSDLSPEFQPQSVHETELQAFVGHKADYYLQKWSPILHYGGTAYGFNWPAFLIAPFWLAYRKMYAVLFILMGIICIESILEDVIFVFLLGQEEVPKLIERGSGFAVAVICGMCANRLYFSHVEKKIAEIRAQGFEGEQLLWQLSKRGGTSLLASLGLTFLYYLTVVAVLIAYEYLMYGW